MLAQRLDAGLQLPQLGCTCCGDLLVVEQLRGSLGMAPLGK